MSDTTPFHSVVGGSTEVSRGGSKPPGQKGRLLELPLTPLPGSGALSIEKLSAAEPPDALFTLYKQNREH